MKKINKKIKIVLAAFLMLLCCNSCNYLNTEPDDIITLDMVFNSKVRTKEWLAGVYAHVPDAYWDWGYAMGFNPLADDVEIPLAWTAFGWWTGNAVVGNWNSATWTNDIWGNTYKAVRSAYIFINNVKPLPNDDLTEDQVAEMKLEARFLIALLYEQMLEVYGPFPLVKGLINSNTSVDELTMQRTPMDEIVGWLDTELLDLSKALPVKVTDPATNSGRPTKGAALACRARLHLIAASPLFNGNTLYKDLKNPDGTNIFPTTYDPNKWKIAADATRVLLDLAETGEYDLYKEYTSTGAIDPFLSYQNCFLTTMETNKEIIFTSNVGVVWEYDCHAYPRGGGGNGAYGVTQELVDAFYTQNGLPIDKDPNYEDSGTSYLNIKYPNTSWNLGNKAGTPGLITPMGTYKMYVNREPRFYISVRYNGQWLPNDQRVTDFSNGGVDGRPSYDSTPCGYLVRKRTSPEAKPKERYTPYRPGIIYRLGEFYLSYAEELNEVSYDTNLTEILKYLNLIRERAGIPIYGSGSKDVAIPANQEDMRQAIRRERQIELNTEGTRYADIRRWMIAKDIFSKPTTGMNVYGTANQFYQRTFILQKVFEDKMYLWPIYQPYIYNNPNLVQNYGW